MTRTKLGQNEDTFLNSAGVVKNKTKQTNEYFHLYSTTGLTESTQEKLGLCIYTQ